jgi:hypothetical protein
MGGPVKGRADYFKPGDWNALCSMCGRKRKASEMVRNWQGLYRCPEHNEQRQPQDFVREVQDVMTVPWSQRPPDSSADETFVKTCTWLTVTAIPGVGGPGCMIPGRKIPGQAAPPAPPPFVVGVQVYSDWSAWMAVSNGVTSLTYAPGLAASSAVPKAVLILVMQNGANSQGSLPAITYGGTNWSLGFVVGVNTYMLWDLAASVPANANFVFSGTQFGWEFLAMVAYNATTKTNGPHSGTFVSNYSQVFSALPTGSMIIGIGKTSDSSPPVVTSSDPSTITYAPADPNPYGNGAYTALHQSPAAGSTTLTYPTPSSIWQGINGIILSP